MFLFFQKLLLEREIPKDDGARLFFGGIFKGQDFNMIFFLTGGATGGVVWLDLAKRDNFFFL